MSLPRELDVRGLSPNRCAHAALGALKRLNPGEPLVVKSDYPPAAVMASARDQLLGPVEWMDLPGSSGDHVFAIYPRCHPTFAAMIELGHDRLDKLLAEVEWRLGQRQYAEARRRFQLFRHSLLRHVDEEERVLHPAFERARGEQARPTIARLRQEHDSMRQLLSRVEGGLRAGDVRWTTAVTAISDLRELLGPHRRQEVDELCPVLAAAEAQALTSSLYPVHRLAPLDG
jgi:uncharacterized protein (DUF2249 family)